MLTDHLPATTPAQARMEFEACREGVYLDVAARAPMSDRVDEALKAYLAVCRRDGAHKPMWLRRVEDIRGQVADLLQARPTEIAFTKNTSDGLNTIAHGLDLADGDNVVVCPELEHGANLYPWLHLQRRGVQVRLARTRGGQYDVDDVRPHIDSRTRVVSLSSVSFVTGARADLAAFAEYCRPRSIFLMVDAVQGLGVVDTDLTALGVDGLAAATQKGLLGIYGLGIMYCRDTWLERVSPPYLSRIGVDLGDAHESEIGDLANYTVKGTAGKFEVGNANFAGLFALEAALSMLNDVGLPTIEQHVSGLAEQLIEGLDRQGIDTVTPRQPDQRAGLVTYRHPDVERLAQTWNDRGIRASVRRGMARVSLHVYNNADDVTQLLDANAAAMGAA